MELWREPELLADQANLILEHAPEGFHQFEAELFRQATDVVMTLNCCCRSFERDRFNHIRIERALGQEFHIRQGHGLFLKDLNKRMADNAPFLFWVVDSSKPLKKTLGRIDRTQIESQLRKDPHHAFCLSLA